MFTISEITHIWLVVANVYYRLFGKHTQGFFYSKNFKTPVVNGLLFTKVIKTTALSFTTNDFYNYSFQFVKYFYCLKTT